MAFLLPLKPRLVASRSARVREDASRTSLLPIPLALVVDGEGKKISRRSSPPAPPASRPWVRAAITPHSSSMPRGAADGSIFTAAALGGDEHAAARAARFWFRSTRRQSVFSPRAAASRRRRRRRRRRARPPQPLLRSRRRALRVRPRPRRGAPPARRMALPLLPALLLGASIAAARGGAVPLREAHFVVELERELRQRRLRLADGRLERFLLLVAGFQPPSSRASRASSRCPPRWPSRPRASCAARPRRGSAPGPP